MVQRTGIPKTNCRVALLLSTLKQFAIPAELLFESRLEDDKLHSNDVCWAYGMRNWWVMSYLNSHIRRFRFFALLGRWEYNQLSDHNQKAEIPTQWDHWREDKKIQNKELLKKRYGLSKFRNIHINDTSVSRCLLFYDYRVNI